MTRDGGGSTNKSTLLDQAETVSRRVEKFAELMQSVWLSKNDYEQRMRKVSCKKVHELRSFLIIATSASRRDPFDSRYMV